MSQRQTLSRRPVGAMGRGAEGWESSALMGRGVWEREREGCFGLEILFAALIHQANRILVAFLLRYLLGESVTVFEKLSFSSELGLCCFLCFFGVGWFVGFFLLWFFFSSFNACKKKASENKMSFSHSSAQAWAMIVSPCAEEQGAMTSAEPSTSAAWKEDSGISYAS